MNIFILGFTAFLSQAALADMPTEISYKEFRPVGGKITIGNVYPQLGLVQSIEFHCLGPNEKDPKKCDIYVPVEHNFLDHGRGDLDHTIKIPDLSLAFFAEEIHQYRELLKYDPYVKHFDRHLAKRVRFDNRFVIFAKAKVAYDNMLREETRFPGFKIVGATLDDIQLVLPRYAFHKIDQRDLVNSYQEEFHLALDAMLDGQWVALKPKREEGMSLQENGTDSITTWKKGATLFFKDIQKYNEALKNDIDFPGW